MSEMAQRVERGGEGEILKLPHTFPLNPLNCPICTRTPFRTHIHSAWIGHVPFAMSLMDLAKPRLLVELGTHWGVSYCAFCQAIKELRLPTECFAVDTWQGDPHATFYTSEVLENLKAYHDERYSLFSRLLQSTFDGALDRFEDSSIDILHIDGYHTYEAVKHDFDTWLPKMSDRGIILLHDIEVRDRESFGVWRFWDEIKQKYPHFAFYHSYGLGVLAVGESIPEGLRPLLLVSQSEGDQIRRYFENLADHLSELQSAKLQQENLAELLHAKAEECQHLHAEYCRLSAQFGEVQRALDSIHSQSWFRAANKAMGVLRGVPGVVPMARGVRKLKRWSSRLRPGKQAG